MIVEEHALDSAEFSLCLSEGAMALRGFQSPMTGNDEVGMENPATHTAYFQPWEMTEMMLCSRPVTFNE